MCLLYDGNSPRLNRKWFYGEAGNRTCYPWFTRHSTYPLHHGGFSKLFVAFPWVETSTGPGGFQICVFIIRRELPKAQPKVVLWRSRELNCDPWFTRYSAYPLHHGGRNFVAFLGINQFRRVGLRFVLVFITDIPKGSPKVVLWRSRESNLRPLVYKV